MEKTVNVNFERKNNKINTPINLNKVNYSGKQTLFIINLTKVSKDFSLIRIFFTMMMLKNDIGSLFRTEF